MCVVLGVHLALRAALLGNGEVSVCPSLLRSSSADRVSIKWGQVESKSGHCFPCPFPSLYTALSHPGTVALEG